MSLQIGERVAGLTFVRADGRAAQLDGFTGRPLLLIFLRHLA